MPLHLRPTRLLKRTAIALALQMLVVGDTHAPEKKEDDSTTRSVEIRFHFDFDIDINRVTIIATPDPVPMLVPTDISPFP